MEQTRQKPRRMIFGLELLGAAYLLGVVVQHLLQKEGPLPRPVPVLVGLAGFTGVVLAGFWAGWRRFLASVFFAVPGLLWLGVLSVLGTLILQNEPAAVLRERYGWFAPVIERMFWGDIFHSLGFCLLLGMIAGGLGLVTVRKRQLTPRALGSLLAHSGLLLMLAGAAMGYAFGIKGRLDLRVGQSADGFLADSAHGPLQVPLGFTVRLDDFRIEHYRPDYQLALYRIEGEESRKLLMVKAGENSRELAARGLEVLAYFPDYRREVHIKPLAQNAPPVPGEAPAAEIERVGGGRMMILEGRPAELLPGLMFFSREEGARAYLTNGAASNEGFHVLTISGRRMSVRAGDRVALAEGGYQIEVAATYLDFVIDEGNRPSERSSRPENPALELYLLDASGQRLARRFLFAKHPHFHGTPAEEEEMKYEFLPPPTPADAILIGESRSLWRLSGWRIESQVALGSEGEFVLNNSQFIVSSLHPRAIETFTESTASAEEKRPLLRLRIAGRDEPGDLVPGKPLSLGPNEVAALVPRGGDTVKDYFSTLSVWENDRRQVSQQIEVNSPLAYGGYYFYQASFRPEEPDYSGLQVVRDPGIWLAYLGFFVNFIGVFTALWVPRLRKPAPPPRAPSG